MRHFILLLSLSALPAAMLTAPGAAAQTRKADGAITYNVKPGDTLIGLAQRYFKRPELYRVVQRQNGIAHPRRIPVGRPLKIARNILKHKPATARLISVRGKVSQSGVQAKKGDIVREGAEIVTAAGSFATFRLQDGSRISLPSNSSLKIRLLRKYDLDNSLDYDFAVGRGGARSNVTPLKSKNDRYRVRSPKAVSAVRGTVYQVRYDAQSDGDFAEVLEGALAMTTGGKNLPLPVGQGLAVAADGKAVVENLLEAPVIISPGKSQTKEIVTFTADKKPGEYGYRYTIARDSAFVEIVSDQLAKEPVYQLAKLDNGNYFARASAVAKSGLQGMPVTFAFRRRLNDIKATADKSDDGFRFRWFGSSQGVQQYHFQLIAGSKEAVPMVDESGLTEKEITISQLPAGDYYWRIGSTLFEDNEASVSWSEFEKISLRE